MNSENKKKRYTINFDEEELEILRRLSEKEGKSEAQILAEALEYYLQEGVEEEQ